MELLERHLRIGARYGGDFVESIDGLSGSSSHLDWFYYVNGVQAPQGAGTTAVHRGDRIWWDLHDWTTTDSIPAVVGSSTGSAAGDTRRRSSARPTPGLPVLRPITRWARSASGSRSGRCAAVLARARSRLWWGRSESWRT